MTTYYLTIRTPLSCPAPPPPQIRGLTRVPTDVDFFINPHPEVPGRLEVWEVVEHLTYKPGKATIDYVGVGSIDPDRPNSKPPRPEPEPEKPKPPSLNDLLPG